MPTLDSIRQDVNRERGLPSNYGTGPAPQLAVRNGRPVAVRRPATAGPTGRGPAVPFDPALSAYLRSMGVEEQAIRAQTRQEGELASRNFQRTSGQYDQRIGEAQRNIANDAAERGMFMSGRTAVDLTSARNVVESERAEAQAALRDQLMALQLGATNQILELRRRAQEEELLGRTRVGQRRAESRYGAI